MLSTQYRVCSVNCAVFCVQSAIYTVQCVVSVLCTMGSMQCSVCSVYCTVFGVQYAVYTAAEPQQNPSRYKCLLKAAPCGAFSFWR